MGIYFNYDYEDGKEVENWVPCFLCGAKKVLFVEYHIKKGPIYTLLSDEARKLWSGKEIKIINDTYLVCEDCYKEYETEDAIISEIIKKKRTAQDSRASDLDTIKLIENEIEETKEKIQELLDKLGNLYERLGKERIKRQEKMLGREDI